MFFLAPSLRDFNLQQDTNSIFLRADLLLWPKTNLWNPYGVDFDTTKKLLWSSNWRQRDPAWNISSEADEKHHSLHSTIDIPVALSYPWSPLFFLVKLVKPVEWKKDAHPIWEGKKQGLKLLKYMLPRGICPVLRGVIFVLCGRFAATKTLQLIFQPTPSPTDLAPRYHPWSTNSIHMHNSKERTASSPTPPRPTSLWQRLSKGGQKVLSRYLALLIKISKAFDRERNTSRRCPPPKESHKTNIISICQSILTPCRIHVVFSEGREYMFLRVFVSCS